MRRRTIRSGCAIVTFEFSLNFQQNIINTSIASYSNGRIFFFNNEFTALCPRAANPDRGGHKNDDVPIGQYPPMFQAHRRNYRHDSPRRRPRPPSTTDILTVNSFFTGQRRHHTIVLHSLTNSINFFRTLLRNPFLPPLIRALDVNFAMASPTQNLR